MRVATVEIAMTEETKRKIEEISQKLLLEFDETVRDLILLGVEIKERQLEESTDRS